MYHTLELVQPVCQLRPTLAIAWPPEDWKISGDHQGAAQVNGIVG